MKPETLKQINKQQEFEYHDENASLYCFDSVETMRTLPPKSVDMVFADPPYNLQLQKKLERPDHSLVKAVDEEWDRFESFAEYDRFTRKWMKAARRVLKDDACLWVIGSYHNIFRVGKILQDLGFWILNDVVWIKNNPMPNFRGTRFTNAHETIIWAGKHKNSKYHFNYHNLKIANEDTQMRSDWYMPICSGKERIKDQNNQKIHPTQKPEQLLYRVLMANTKRNDLVLDPFMGSGTTGAVCRKLKRRFIGIDNCQKYFCEAKKRIQNAKPYHEDTFDIFINNNSRKQKIPFATLVETGELPPGSKLYQQQDINFNNDKMQKNRIAKIQVDGSIACEDFTGSIHKVGTLVSKKSSCNGWTFWHYKNQNGKFFPINMIRKRIIEKIGANNLDQQKNDAK